MNNINCKLFLKKIEVKDTYSMHVYLINRMKSLADVNFYTIPKELFREYIDPLFEMPLYAFKTNKEIENINIFLTNEDISIDCGGDSCPCPAMKWYQKNIGDIKI